MAVEANAQAAVEADAAAAGDNAAAALSSFASRSQAAVGFAPVLAFVPPSAEAAFVTSSTVTSSSVPASRIFFCGCSQSLAAAGADADAAGALGTPLLFPFLFFGISLIPLFGRHVVIDTCVIYVFMCATINYLPCNIT